jgi:hypothetical protein
MVKSCDDFHLAEHTYLGNHAEATEEHNETRL